MISRYLSPDTITIFISYAQKDKLWYEKLETQLGHEKLQGSIITRSHKEMLLGASYKTTIAEQIATARIILLLISPNFWDDQRCLDEMQQTLRRSQDVSVQIIPIRLADTAAIDWEETKLGQFSALPGDGRSIQDTHNSDHALYEVVVSVLALVKTMRQGQQQERPIGYHSLIMPPQVHQAGMVQRPQLVQQIYQTLTGSSISALALVGIRGIGKATLATLLYDYAEQQRLAGTTPLTGKTLWLQIDATVTLADIVSTLREEWQLSPLNLAAMTIEQIIRELTKTLQTLPCLIILNHFEKLLDPQTGRTHHLGISEWLDEINAQPSPARLLLTSSISPHTTRPHLFLHEYDVPPLTVEEGKAVLRLYSIKASESEIRLAVERCHGHALALVLISQLLNQDRSIRLTDLFQRDIFGMKRIETMAKELLDYIFKHQLNQDQRDLLGAFAIYREAVPVEAAQAVISIFNAMPLERIAQAHGILLSQYLLIPMGDRRYQSHGLISEFALQKMAEGPEHNKLLQRAHIQAAHYYQQQAGQPIPPRKQRKGLAGIHNFIEAIWHLCQAKRQREAYTLIAQERIFYSLQSWGSNSTLLEIYHYLDPSRWKPTPAIGARIYNEIGEIYHAIGKWHDASYHFKLALDGFRALDQQNNMVDALNSLGTIYHQQGQIEDARACYEEARQLSEHSQEKITNGGTTLNNLGYMQSRLGHQERRRGQKEKAYEHYRQALELYQQALPLHRDAKHFREEARTLNNIGEIEQMQGHLESAETYYQQALTYAREHEERWIEAMALNNLGVLAKKSQDPEIGSLEYYKQALVIYRAIGARAGERTVLKNLGYWYLALQQHEAALAFFVLARNISHELDDDSDAELPRTALRELRLILGEQTLQVLQHDMETQAEQIVEQALLS